MKRDVGKAQSVAESAQAVADNVVYPEIAEWYGCRPGGRKLLERHAECCSRTAQGIISGEHKPSTTVLMRILARNRDLFLKLGEALGHLSDQVGEKVDERLDRLETKLAELEQLKREVAELRK